MSGRSSVARAARSSGDALPRLGTPSDRSRITWRSCGARGGSWAAASLNPLSMFVAPSVLRRCTRDEMSFLVSPSMGMSDEIWLAPSENATTATRSLGSSSPMS